MGRSRAAELSPEETERIIELLKQKKSVKAIMTETGRSETKIYQIKHNNHIGEDEVNLEKWYWLYHNWHWKIPDKEPEKRKSHFRTPYNRKGG